MNAIEIIEKKRDGGELSAEEIAFFVQGVVAGEVADYQASAWLMAVFLRGMTERETLALTLAMRDSGDWIRLDDLPGLTLDKHSTGGVGDKTTLVVAPILAAGGVPMLKMSGRGLGFSGGTVDKLESIPGFRPELRIAEAKEQVRRIGAALIAQSGELCPADKMFYALRDATGTVPSLPLIASSIMSKKLAAGAARIVLDVKVGRGAFMKTQAEAERLAQAMVAIGNGAGVPTVAELTAMEEPLGFAVGNALEAREALDILTNAPQVEPRFRRLCLELAASGFRSVGLEQSESDAFARAVRILESGQAAEKFAEIVAAQGGPAGCEAIRSALPIAPLQVAVPAETSGSIAGIDAEAVGRLAMQMGAGRLRKTDAIDPAVGVLLHQKTGDRVEPGEALATLHLRAADAGRAEAFAAMLRVAYTIQAEAVSVAPSLTLATIAGKEPQNAL